MSREGMKIESVSFGFMRVAKFFVKLTIYIVVIFLIGSQLFKFGNRLFYERAMDEENPKTIEFVIAESDTTEDIAKKLVNVGLIDDELAFRFRSVIYKIKFAPGTYTLKTNMTIKNMLDIFDNAAAVAVTSTEAVETEEVQIETVVEEGTVNE